MPRAASIFVCTLAGLAAVALSAVVGWPAWLMLIGGVGLGVPLGAVLGRRPAGDGPAPPAPRTAVPAAAASLVTLESLTDLDLRAKVRGDFDTAGLVDRLQALFDRLRQCEATAERDEAVLTYKLRRAYDNAADFCERALTLHLARREMVTDEGREKVDAQRAALLGEVRTAVSSIEQAIDRLRAASHTSGDVDRQRELADLNADLDRRLEVARRVEARMAELEVPAVRV